MKRRGFLAALASATGAFALDPERALWVPGAKTISVPTPRVFELRYINAANRLDLMDWDWLLKQCIMQVEVIQAAPNMTWIGPRCD